MIGKGTMIYSVLKMKCPRCQDGNFFKGHPYRFEAMGAVKERCAKCDQKFALDTGFYQGSYYVSYGLGVALFIAVVLVHYIFIENLNPTHLMLSFFISLLILFPLLYALSKIIWTNMFIKFEKSQSSKTI